MKEKKEQISIEFARKLFGDWSGLICNGESFESGVLKMWKQKGYIKQSREEEIREKIKNYEKSVCYPNKETTQYEYMQYQKELIEILDNKAKNK